MSAKQHVQFASDRAHNKRASLDELFRVLGFGVKGLGLRFVGCQGFRWTRSIPVIPVPLSDPISLAFGLGPPNLQFIFRTRRFTTHFPDSTVTRGNG